MADPLVPVDPLRLRHHRGQALRGHDFTDQSDQDDQLRWWHNRALHRAYGIARGLEVTIAEGTATVAPGLAYDCHGRELILEQARRVPVPEGGETPELVLARGAGGVVLCWLPPGAAAHVDGVRLGAAGDAPARVRPFARPRIGRGATVPGSTAWVPWAEVAGEQQLQLGIQVDVDTSAASFTATPCYFAQLTGSIWDGWLMMPLIPFEHIAGPQRDRFTFRLLMPWLYQLQGVTTRAARVSTSRADYREAVHGLARLTDLAVTWLGIQHQKEGPP